MRARARAHTHTHMRVFLCIHVYANTRKHTNAHLHIQRQTMQRASEREEEEEEEEIMTLPLTTRHLKRCVLYIECVLIWNVFAICALLCDDTAPQEVFPILFWTLCHKAKRHSWPSIWRRVLYPHAHTHTHRERERWTRALDQRVAVGIAKFTAAKLNY